jgi:hypothetical protein
MFTVQNTFTGQVWGCTQREAWLWSKMNDALGGSVYNIFGPCTTHTLSTDEIARHA